MTKRFGSLAAATSVLATASVFALPAAAHADGSLPTLTVALKGITGVSVSGSEVSGAVSVAAAFTGQGDPLRAKHQRASVWDCPPQTGGNDPAGRGRRQCQWGGPKRVDPLRQPHRRPHVPAPATVQPVLTPGGYVALNATGNGQPGFAPFTVTQSTLARGAAGGGRTRKRPSSSAFGGPPCCTTGRWCGPRTTATSCT